MNIIRKRLFVKGMTCINCQNRIEQRLSETAGIKKVKVSYNKGTADVTYDTDEISLKDIVGIIKELGYGAAQEQSGKQADLERIISLLILIVSLYILLQQFGVLNLLVPNQLADSKMGYGMLFVVGLLTSVHCIAMCGGINLSCCIPREKAGSASERFSTVLPAFRYNAGRIISYTAIGFLLGFVGMLLGGGTQTGLSAFFQGVLKLIAGLFMVIMGMNMLDLFPWLKRFGLRMPGSFAAVVGRQKRKGSGPFFIGLLNGLMPCGPLQSMQIVALASQNPVSGALSMFFFSLGTVPLMLGLGTLVSALGKRFTQTVMNVGAVLVTVLGLAMVSQGVSLSGLLGERQLVLLVIALAVLGVAASIPVRKAAYKCAGILAAVAAVLILGSNLYRTSAAQTADGDAGQAAMTSETGDGVQVVNSTLTVGRYPNITVQAGIPVKWIIDAPAGSINGCNYKMLIRDYGIEHTFVQGENVIEFTPQKAGTVTYTCWMGMIRGNIFVTENAAGTQTASEDSGSSAAPDSDETQPSADPLGSLIRDDADIPYPADFRIPADELAVAQKMTAEDGSQVQNVEIALTQEGFSPAVIVVERGIETSWTIQNELADGAEGTELLAALYSTTLPLAEGENVLYLYPAESFDVSTGDSAFYAYVKVVDDLESMNEEEIRKEVEEYVPYVYPSSAFEGTQAGGSCCY